MNKKVKIVLIIIVLILISIVVYLYLGFRALSGFNISHIESNVPDKEYFEEYLIRDLNSYFSEILETNPEVHFELLRDGPTQAGLGLPKYYLWLEVFVGGELGQSGAAVVAALEKEYFDVMEYVTIDEIIADPDKLKIRFPTDVSCVIFKKSGLDCN